jgi:hypothetical protein
VIVPQRTARRTGAPGVHGPRADASFGGISAIAARRLVASPHALVVITRGVPAQLSRRRFGLQFQLVRRSTQLISSETTTTVAIAAPKASRVLA